MIREELRELAREIFEILTNGWTEHEKSHWKDYLEEEVKPYFPRLYLFLKTHFEEKRR